MPDMIMGNCPRFNGFTADATTPVSSPLTVEHRHLMRIVALARRGSGRHGLLDAGQVGGIQPGLQRAQGLGELVAAARADHRHDVVAAGEHPGDGELARR